MIGEGEGGPKIVYYPNYLLSRLVASSLAIMDIFTLIDKKCYETSCLSKICANRQSFKNNDSRTNESEF